MDFEPVFATTITESSDPEVEAVGRMAQGEDSRLSGQVLHTHTRKDPHKLNLEQRLNDSVTSTASGEHRTFYAHIPLSHTKSV